MDVAAIGAPTRCMTAAYAGCLPKKRQGMLGCEKTISIADLPDLGAAAFIRGWLKPAQPVQKAVVPQRLQGANNGVSRPL